MPTSWPERIARRVQPYNPIDLMTSVAALQLLPQNAERALRLEALANVISTLPCRHDNPVMSITKLRRVCNSPPLADISSQEDPSEQAFTEAFTFIGGSYVVFPGIVDDATFVLRHLAQAITQYKKPFPRVFYDTAVRTLGAGLTLSDLVTTRAGLSRGIPPSSTVSKVYVPRSSELSRLKHAVQIKYEDLEQALRVRGFDLHALDPLTVGLGETSLDECAPTTGPLDDRPLVQAGDSVILAVPGLMLAALRHKLICLAQEYGVASILAEGYRHAVWQTVTWSLDFLQHEPSEPSQVPLPPTPSEMPTIDGVFSMDTDKALYVSLTADNFREYDKDQVFGMWECPELPEQLEKRQRTVEEFLVEASSGLNEIVVLHLTAGAGRSYILGFGHPPAPLESPRLCMDASDFEIIALLEGGNSLMLRKYAIASTRLRDHAQIFAWSELDEFSIYRGNQYSYYLSDEARPTMITVTPGSGLELRLQVIKEFDCHAVPAFEPGYFTEVVRISQNYEMPIYLPTELIVTKRQCAFVIEGLPVHVWVVGPDYKEEPEQHEIAQVYTQVADMIAYWIWQFSSSLAPLLCSFRKRSPVLILKLRATPSKNWLARAKQGDQWGDYPIAEYELLENENTILLRVNPGLQRALETPNNQGERDLMAIVLRGLDEIVLESEAEGHLTSQDIRTILDKYAPLGRKKKALVLDPHENPALSTSGLSQHRSVQMADKTALLDEVGRHLMDELGMPVGPIREKECTKVLGQVVDFLYQKLQGLVSTLNPRVLLDWLVRYHEAIRYDMAHFRLTIPTRSACFGAGEEFNAIVTEELQDLYEAAQAARCVIEYVSAQPPSGLRPMSWSVYDELQALATEITLWAGISDLIYYGIADIELSILPSGRLGSNYHAVTDQANKGFLPLHSLERIDRAESLFEKHWPSTAPLPKRPPAEVEEIDTAFQAEFGYTLTELTTLMADCFVLGTEQESPVKRLPVDEMVERLSENIAYPISKVARMLEDLSLESRADFLEPPSPFRREDVYPWRFGRPLAYIRRPLIRTTENGRSTFMWGNLHLYDSRNYIIDMCLSGRLQSRSTSQEMRSLLARFNQERGSAFTLQVRDLFEIYEGLIVDSNIKKIGRARIAQCGNDLGDIDVLVINPCRRRVLVIECKDLSIARNPYEMANEIETLFVDADKPPTVVRHQRRANWIKDNLSLVLGHYGVDSKGKWQIEPTLVVSEEMLTPHIYHPPMPVISFRTLKRQFVEEWI
jgi:hypothetical protein